MPHLHEMHLGCVTRKPVFGVSDKIRLVLPQKIARCLKFRKFRDCSIYVAKRKALISCTATVQLI